MAAPIKANDIGMKRGKLLANLPRKERLDLIAEGLPVLMKSAKGLFDAAALLSDQIRSSTILRGHGLEEVAKILILVDLVRCPVKLCASKAGPLMSWFYDHQARLTFLEAQHYYPVSITQLQAYVNPERQSHYLDGEFGEYIVPNAAIFRRESRLYADLITYEEGEPIWNDPEAVHNDLFVGSEMPWHVCQALQSVGAFTRPGLDVMATTWDRQVFEGDAHPELARVITKDMLSNLEKQGLFAEDVNTNDLTNLYRHWQMPMYALDFRAIKLSLEELQAQRDASVEATLNSYM